MVTPGLETRIETLLGVLDTDIKNIETTLARLERLRVLLVQRDDKGLESLLTDSHGHAEAHAANEQRRQDLRTELATMLGWSPGDLTLSKLCAHLPEPMNTALADRQLRLRGLVSRLRREHMLAALLVSDCARFNRSLMQALFGVGRSGTMYGADGSARHRTETGLMSLQF